MLRLSNHPIHLVSNAGNYSLSAFIPFCAFGGDMSLVGTQSHLFEAPVCNSFQAKILNDQLCYEVDLNSFSNKDNIQNELKSGFLFILDYNEDRQVTLDKSNMHVEDKGLISRMMKSDGYQDASIYLNTIGQLREW